MGRAVIGDRERAVALIYIYIRRHADAVPAISTTKLSLVKLTVDDIVDSKNHGELLSDAFFEKNAFPCFKYSRLLIISSEVRFTFSKNSKNEE